MEEKKPAEQKDKNIIEVEKVVEVEIQEPKPIDYFDKVASRYRVRLSGMIQGKNKLVGNVEVMDSTFHLKDRLSFSQLEDLGWTITVNEYGIDIEKDDKKYIATAWPIDPFGRVSQRTLNTTVIAK